MTAANYYYLSNDAIDLAPLRRAKGQRTLLGVASPDVLHVLGGIAAGRATLRDCVLFDNNPAQLAHLDRLLGLVAKASDRFDFVERLLCIRLGSAARQALNAFRPSRPWRIPGATAAGGHGELEKRVWMDSEFDAAAFQAQTGLRGRMVGNGLRLASEVVGGMDSYLLTLLCVDTDEYPRTPFCVRYGYGYMSSEQAFARLQRLLVGLQPALLRADAAHDLLPMLREHRYERLLLWVSNIFTPYFIERHPTLGETAEQIVRLATSVSSLPQADITVIADGRIAGPLGKIRPRGWLARWRMTAHYKSFAAVRRWLLDGPALEIVNMPTWIAQDQGQSKLPDTRYVLLEDFLLDESIPHCHTIFLHILQGHGATEQEMLTAFNKARTVAKRVLVLEHNSQSLDFIRRRDLVRLDRIVGLLGRPTRRVPVSGTFSRARNWLLVYDLPVVVAAGKRP